VVWWSGVFVSRGNGCQLSSKRSGSPSSRASASLYIHHKIVLLRMFGLTRTRSPL